jgi:hypothetical protein
MPESDTRWNARTAIEQIEKCGFECEAGPIEQNTAFVFVRDALALGPEFFMGQGVFYTVTAESPAGPVEAVKFFYIVGCRMASDTEKRLWTYSLSNDPPRPWHYGEVQYSGVRASEISLTEERPQHEEKSDG